MCRREDFSKIIGDPAASDADRAVALRFIVHFLGDIHQPLHAADNHDRGGNAVTVIFEGQRVKLHHLWDTELVLAIGGQDQETTAARLDRTIAEVDAARWSTGMADDWLNESHQIAVRSAYGTLPAQRSTDLAGGYADAAMPLVEEQLKKAGIRLAGILNTSLK